MLWDSLIQASRKRSTSDFRRGWAQADPNGAFLPSPAPPPWRRGREKAGPCRTSRPAPEDTATPSRSRRGLTAVSALDAGKPQTAFVLGRPLGLRAEHDCGRHSGFEARLQAGRAARPCVRSSAAQAPSPRLRCRSSETHDRSDILGTGAGQPRSWPPPLIRGIGKMQRLDRRLINGRRPPLGPPILCPESVRRSACISLISHVIRPAPLDRVKRA